MVDTVSVEVRSKMMGKVRSKNTEPELLVRSALHRMGLRFRIHRKDLPGRPDIILPRHRLAIFVHGCFWHRHLGCKHASTPNSNVAYWEAKFATTVSRDSRNRASLEQQGWTVVVIWECEARDGSRLQDILQQLPYKLD